MLFEFESPPNIGHEIEVAQIRYRLTTVEPYRRKDGSESFVLTWQGTDGRVATSGMRGKSLTKVRLWGDGS